MHDFTRPSRLLFAFSVLAFFTTAHAAAPQPEPLHSRIDRMLDAGLDHPVASIWAAHQGVGEVARVENWRPEEVLITRPEAEVLLRVLPPGGFAFASALLKGASVAEAHQAAGVEHFDAGAHLVGLIEAGALTKLTA